MIADDIAAGTPPQGPAASAACRCCAAIATLPMPVADELSDLIRGTVTHPHTGKCFTDREVAAWLGQATTRHITVANVTNCRMRHFGVMRRA